MQVLVATRENFTELIAVLRVWENEMGYDTNQEEIVEYLAGCSCVLYVKNQDDNIVGIMTGDITKPFWVKTPILTENWLFVHTHYRSEGYGTALIAMFEAWAKSSGCGCAVVTPNKYGTSTPEVAAGLLRKHGYETFGYVMRKKV